MGDIFKCLRCEGYTGTVTGDGPFRCGVCGKVRSDTVFVPVAGPDVGPHRGFTYPDPGPVVLRKRGGGPAVRGGSGRCGIPQATGKVCCSWGGHDHVLGSVAGGDVDAGIRALCEGLRLDESGASYGGGAWHSRIQRGVCGLAGDFGFEGVMEYWVDYGARGRAGKIDVAWLDGDDVVFVCEVEGSVRWKSVAKLLSFASSMKVYLYFGHDPSWLKSMLSMNDRGRGIVVIDLGWRW